MTQVSLASLLKGAATFLPLVSRLACRRSGATASARYCYGVWFRHLILAQKAGLWNNKIKTVAELGPGDSIATGLAAMLSGIDRYYAFDAKPHARKQRSSELMESLLDLFARRAPVPDHFEFPQLHPRLSVYEFPRHILTDELLAVSLHPKRLARIRACLDSAGLRGHVSSAALQEHPQSPEKEVSIVYVAPWDYAHVAAYGIDWVFSQAVLEHVEDVAAAYRALGRWVKPGGFMSHTIDFKSHGLTRRWNGHWTVSKVTWKIVRGRRPYLINRLPYSAHIREMLNAGFLPVSELKTQAEELPREELALQDESFTDEDLRTSGLFILAVKPT